MLRVISEIRPAFVVAENVRGAVNLALDTVQAGMEDEGYEVRTLLLPAAAFGAPHKRERMFVFGIRKDVADRLCLGSEAGIPRQNARKEGESNLSDYIGEDGGAFWPTPCSRGNDGGGPIGLGGGARARRNLDERVGEDARKKLCSGSLNPAWVEILMGFPLGWTDVDCDEPEPWPGWPMRLWAGNWPTPQCFDATAGDLKGKEYTGENRHALKLGNCINSQIGQYPYEPPRTVTGCPNRAKRLKCLGNAVVPQQARPIFEAIRQIHNFITCECFT